MIVSCDNCELIFNKYLCDMPEVWRLGIVSTICKALFEVEVGCEEINKCEKLTKLSAFTQQADKVCISYLDENNQSVQRCFQFPGLLDTALADVDPYCIATPEEWINMTFTEKIEAILEHKCNCC